MNMMPVGEQWLAFLLTVFTGALVGFVLDGYRVWRWSLKKGRLRTALGDITVWVLMAPPVFALLFLGNWGELRLYVFVGWLIGVLSYLRFAGRLTRRGWKVFFRLGRQAVRFAWVVVVVAAWPVRVVFLPVTALGRGIGWTVGRIRHLLHQGMSLIHRPPPPST